MSVQKIRPRKYGLDVQRRVLTDFCKSRGWPVEFFVDAGISGKSIEGRPEFKRMMKAVAAKLYKGV